MSEKPPSVTAGYVALTVAQLAIAANVILGKLLGARFPSYGYVWARFMVSSGIFACLFLMRRESRLFLGERITRRNLMILAGYCLTGGIMFNLAFFEGINHTSAGVAGIIGSALPGFIAVFAFLFLKEKLTRNKLLGIGLACLGIFTISIQALKPEARGRAALLGCGLILLAMIPQSLYSIMGRLIRGEIDVVGSALMLNVVSSVLLAPLALRTMTPEQLTSMLAWPWLALILAEGTCSFTFFFLWTKGLQKVPASTAAVFGSVLPVGSAAFGMVILGEALSPYDIVGMVLVVASIVIGTRAPIPQGGERRNPAKSLSR